MRPFHLYRRRDETGVSGTGIVAEGVMFGDGTVSMRWCVPDKPKSTTAYATIDDVLAIHGHDGLTTVLWVE